MFIHPSVDVWRFPCDHSFDIIWLLCIGRGNAQTGMNNMQMRGMLPWMMAGGDAMDAMEDMMPMMMLQRMYQ